MAQKVRICLFLLWALLILPVLGQVPLAPKKAQPLQLKASISDSSPCLSDEVTITIKLINQSENYVGIKSSEIWSFISFVTFHKEADGGGIAETHTITPGETSHSRDRYVLLAPGQSYKTTETITIDKGYFQIKKLYELTVSYLQLRPQTVKGAAVWVGMIDSNKIKVRILACPDKNPDSDKNRPAKDNSEE